MICRPRANDPLLMNWFID